MVVRFIADEPGGEEVRVRAMESGQFSAAVAAIKEKGVLSGKRVERAEVGPPGAFEALTDNELERALIERFSAIRFCGTPLPPPA